MRVRETPIEINGELIEPPPIMYGPPRGSNNPDVLVSSWMAQQSQHLLIVLCNYIECALQSRGLERREPPVLEA